MVRSHVFASSTPLSVVKWERLSHCVYNVRYITVNTSRRRMNTQLCTESGSFERCKFPKCIIRQCTIILMNVACINPRCSLGTTCRNSISVILFVNRTMRYTFRNYLAWKAKLCSFRFIIVNKHCFMRT